MKGDQTRYLCTFVLQDANFVNAKKIIKVTGEF